MRKNLYAPVKFRKDGSIYSDRNHSVKKFFAGLVMIFALPAFFTAILMFALIDPFNTYARQFENEAASDTNSIVNDFTNPEDTPTENRPSILPVTGKLTGNFGLRRNPLHGPRFRFHRGIDIAVPVGTSIIAPADGEVIFTGVKHGYGNTIVIRHSDKILTYYAHLSRFSVSLNQPVRQGEEIGKTGSTGRSTGPHLHYEIRVNDEAVDPFSYLLPVR